GDGLFVEIMRHDLEIERRAAEGLRKIAADLSLPFVATNDSHYTSREDAGPHEALLCVQTATTLADPDRFRFEGTDYYLRSPAEMRALGTDEDWQAACDTTLLIADRVSVGFDRRDLMPAFPLPPGHTAP